MQANLAYSANHHGDLLGGNGVIELNLNGAGELKLAHASSSWGELYRYRTLQLWVSVMSGDCGGLTLAVVHEQEGNTPVYSRPLPVDVRRRWQPIFLSLYVRPHPLPPASLVSSSSLFRDAGGGRCITCRGRAGTVSYCAVSSAPRADC